VNSDGKDKPSSAKSAMLDYYDDVLGSLVNDPLLALVQEESRAKSLSSSAKIKKHSHAESLADPKRPSEQTLQRKRKQVKKLPPTFYDETYEKELNAEIVAPLIIPAAFPKLAPKKIVVPKEGIVEVAAPVKKMVAKAVVEAKKVKVVEVNQTLAKQLLPKKSAPKSITNEVKPVQTTAPETIHASALDLNTNLEKGGALISSDNKIAGVSKLNGLPENGRPVWAQERFECLLFSVAGLQLAVPLVSLGAIYKIESDFTPLVGRASWFMGLCRHDERNVRVVDTAQLVMPDRVEDSTRSNYRYIIRLGGNSWGMACDAVQEAIQLEPEEVKWRTERSKRAWLSGTVIEHMCALIDVDSLTDLLKKEALSKHSSFNA